MVVYSQEIPEGDWFCDPCALGLAPGTLKCELCATSGGALLPVADLKKREVKRLGLCLWLGSERGRERERERAGP
jgi:hypothetical protein